MNDEISIIMRMTCEELVIWGALLKEWRVLFCVKKSFSFVSLNGGSFEATIVVII